MPPSEPSPARVRIGIVDDDSVLASALSHALSAESDFEVAGLAESLEEGFALLERAVDVLLVDLGLPDGSGLELIDRARSSGNCRVLVISVFGDGRSVVDAIERGAQGYLLKGQDAASAVDAVRSVLAGGAPISPAVAGHILARVRGAAPKRRPERTSFALTPREVTILEQLAKGLSFKDVAQVEGISPHTVTDHVKSIYKKLAVSSRGEAVFEAIQSGIIDVRE